MLKTVLPNSRYAYAHQSSHWFGKYGRHNNPAVVRVFVWLSLLHHFCCYSGLGLSLDSPWTVSGLSLECLWTASRLCVVSEVFCCPKNSGLSLWDILMRHFDETFWWDILLRHFNETFWWPIVIRIFDETVWWNILMQYF